MMGLQGRFGNGLGAVSGLLGARRSPSESGVASESVWEASGMVWRGLMILKGLEDVGTFTESTWQENMARTGA